MVQFCITWSVLSSESPEIIIIYVYLSVCMRVVMYLYMTVPPETIDLFFTSLPRQHAEVFILSDAVAGCFFAGKTLLINWRERSV